MCTSTSSLLTKFRISPTSGILDSHFRPPFTCSHLFSSFPPASCQLLLFTFRFFTAQHHLINACCSCVVTSPISNDNTFVPFYTVEIKRKQEMCLFVFFLTPHILDFLNGSSLYHFFATVGNSFATFEDSLSCTASCKLQPSAAPLSLFSSEKQRR